MDRQKNPAIVIGPPYSGVKEQDPRYLYEIRVTFSAYSTVNGYGYRDVASSLVIGSNGARGSRGARIRPVPSFPRYGDNGPYADSG